MSSINEKILKIMALALEISPADERKAGKPLVRVEYSPIGGSVSVTLYRYGWNENIEPDFYAYVSGCYYDDKTEELNKIIAYLEELKNGLI